MSQPPSKLSIAKRLLAESGSVFVHLDGRVAKCVLPTKLRMRYQSVLQVGHSMPVPIPDLCFDGDGMHATLQFKRTPFTCFVPWNAVFALVGDDGKGMVWEGSVPPEVRAEMVREHVVREHAAPEPAAPVRTAHPSERPYLRRVK